MIPVLVNNGMTLFEISACNKELGREARESSEACRVYCYSSLHDIGQVMPIFKIKEEVYS